MKHLFDAPGDYCRYPMWNDAGKNGNRLTCCANPGYPYCEKHQIIVSQRRAERASGLKHGADRVVIWGRP